jgi:DNA (cytosine-5)-methyltransferase 1
VEVINNLPFKIGNKLELQDHPSAIGLEGLHDFASNLVGPLAIDLFSGAGGMSLGLEEAGFNVILGVDRNRDAVATHRAYFPGVSMEGDLSRIETIDSIVNALSGIPIDLIAGCPPCQPFSRASQSKNKFLASQSDSPQHDSRRDLWEYFRLLIERLSPEALLMENVPEICFGEYTGIFRKQISSLEQLGYMLYPRIVSSDDYGVPQKRQRLIIVGLKSGIPFTWPDLKDSPFSLRDAIGDLPHAEPGMDQTEAPYNPPVVTGLQEYYREGLDDTDLDVIYDHSARRVRDDDLKAFEQLTAGMKYSDLEDEFEGTTIKRYRDDIFKDKYNRLPWDQPSRTITAHLAKDGYWYIHPDDNRTLTIREAARIQTFPDRFRFCGFPTSQYHQIGEAVPPILARELGEHVKAALSGGRPHQDPLYEKELTATDPELPPSSFDILEALESYRNLEKDNYWSKPWRNSGDYWQNLLGTIISRGMDERIPSRQWTAIKNMWATPGAYINDKNSEDDSPRIHALVAYGIRHFDSQLRRLAELIESGHPDATNSQIIANEVLDIDGLTPTTVEEALLLSGQSEIITGLAPQRRMAARLHGESTWDNNMNSRMLLTRSLGDVVKADRYGRFIEISEQFCGLKPDCHTCPMNSICITGKRSSSSFWQPFLTPSYQV